MANIIGVRFRNIGKVYYFDPGDLAVRTGDHVVVETARGTEYGRVVFMPREIADEKVTHPLKKIKRLATPEDDIHEEELHQKEKEAYKICVQKIKEHELDMKLIEVEYAFDNSKILFYFTAEGRIDFRLLVKNLAAIFKTRIELRQIGVRDETKHLGGIGICGRELCCRTYLSEFAPVSIRMAKEQYLSLNQTKISGVCGRLMCCLKNEQETYEELNRNLPSVGDDVVLPDGLTGKVHSVNVLRQLVKVTVEINDEKELMEFPVSEIKFKAHKKKESREEEDQDFYFDDDPDIKPVKKEEQGKKEEKAGKRSRTDGTDKTEKPAKRSEQDKEAGKENVKGDHTEYVKPASKKQKKMKNGN